MHIYNISGCLVAATENLKMSLVGPEKPDFYMIFAQDPKKPNICLSLIFMESLKSVFPRYLFSIVN